LKTQRPSRAPTTFAQKSNGPPLRRAIAVKLVALASGAALLAALPGLILAAMLAALTALAALMLLTGPVLRALPTLAAALLRTLVLLLIALRIVLLVRHWEILRLLVWECTPRRNLINARRKLKFVKPMPVDTVNEL
jgi:hypothetical protein